MFRRIRVAVSVVVAMVGLPLVVGEVFAQTSGGADQVFLAPGSFDVVVPAGVTRLGVDLHGGQGQGFVDREGGFGARIVGMVPVTPGETLKVFVGGAGEKLLARLTVEGLARNLRTPTVAVAAAGPMFVVPRMVGATGWLWRVVAAVQETGSLVVAVRLTVRLARSPAGWRQRTERTGLEGTRMPNIPVVAAAAGKAAAVQAAPALVVAVHHSWSLRRHRSSASRRFIAVTERHASDSENFLSSLQEQAQRRLPLGLRFIQLFLSTTFLLCPPASPSCRYQWSVRQARVTTVRAEKAHG
jgi:hypothetical protein